MPRAPASLASYSSFYVGGRQVRIEGRPSRRIAFTAEAELDYDPNGLFSVEQAYVQRFEPAASSCPVPIVLLHGGGFTGSMWEHTPDGRPGWLHAFLAAGLTVYLVDNVERGRAGWCPFPEIWPGEPVLRSAEEAWTLFRFGAAEGFAERRAFPEQRFPVVALDEFLKGFVPRWAGSGARFVDAFGAVLDRIGRCIVLAHSQGCDIAFRAAASRPANLAALVAVEPSGYPEDPAGFAAVPILYVMGDRLDATPLWVTLAERTAASVAALQAAGCPIEHWSLPAEGIRGNSHMLMLDDNSGEIAGRIAAWAIRATKPGLSP